MIALCSLHHPKADAGGFTVEQLHTFKTSGFQKVVEGRFDWMRNSLLAVVGGNFYYKTATVFQMSGRKLIYFNRDSNGYLLVNAAFPTGVKQRVELIDNDWVAHGELEDLDCPPSGKLIEAKYPNGDRMRIEFSEMKDADELERQHSFVPRSSWESSLQFPLTIVTAELNAVEQGIRFDARHTSIPGLKLEGCFAASAAVAISV